MKTKNDLLILCISPLILFASVSCSQAQNSPPASTPTNTSKPVSPPPALVPTKEIGKAKVFKFAAKNDRPPITAVISSTVLDSRNEKGKLVEQLNLDLRFDVEGDKVIKPHMVTADFSAYTNGVEIEKYKNEDNRKLTLVIDGVANESKNLPIRNEVKWSKDSRNINFEVALDFALIERMATAKNVVLRLGNKDHSLKYEQRQFIRDLIETVGQ